MSILICKMFYKFAKRHIELPKGGSAYSFSDPYTLIGVSR
jgi:hypothetical protein